MRIGGDVRLGSWWALLAASLLGLGCSDQGAGVEPGSLSEAIISEPDFTSEIVVNDLDMPTAVRFASDGKLYVAEKSGLIKRLAGFNGTPQTIADLRTEVYDYWDRGLLDIELHPQFPAQPFIYALYTLDGRPGDSLAAGTVPRYNDNCTDASDACVCMNRLDRIELNPATGTMVAKSTLIENWGNQYPSHAVGSLAWGPDGFLYVSSGDGASFTNVDYGANNALGDPPNAAGSLSPPSAMGGALRSQVVTPPPATPAFPTWFNGKVLRVDPEAMTPMLDPKAVTGAPPIVAKGLRNPFRMTFREGTDELWIADVGWGDWEEINRIANIGSASSSPPNFGWPCYEGNTQHWGYQSANLSVCQNLYATPAADTEPFFAYAHGSSVVAGDGCGQGGSSITGLAFGGSAFPPAYNDALFFADYARRCVWYLPAGGNNQPSSTPRRFASNIGAVVQLLEGPDGDLYYVDIEAGSVGRFHHSVGNHAPQAVISANPLAGPAPLSVTFDGSSSSDSDPGDQLTYAWDLDGDGQYDDGTGVTASYVYTGAQPVTVRLRVTDLAGAQGNASTIVRTGNAPTPQIQVISGTDWSVGDAIRLAGSATDVEDGALSAASFEWEVIMQHCPNGHDDCHAHVIDTFDAEPEILFLAPEHDYPSHLDIVLRVTDSEGLVGSTTLTLNPATTQVTVNTVPPGLLVAINQSAGPSPHDLTVIRGAPVSVSAATQTLGGTLYEFASWSDGGSATHILEPTTPTLNLTATFTASAVESALTAAGTPIALITAPLGGGSKDLGIIKDGVKPAVGTNNDQLQYDTFAGGGARDNDWVGYSFSAPKQFTRLIFQEGMSFVDGGAFTTLAVQVRSAGVWSNVSGLQVAPTYAGLNGVHYETYNLTFSPTTGDAIRIYGPPAGAARFVSIAELEVYGSEQAGPPPNQPPTANAGIDRTVNVGSAVTLGGSGSDPEGLPVTYQWSQAGGVPVALSGASTATPSFTAPAASAVLTFELVTNDGNSSSAADAVVVTVNDPSAPVAVNLTAQGTPIAFITAPTGGGNKNLDLIKDGVKPAVGTNNDQLQYDTFAGGGARPSDWIGYSFTAPKQLTRLVFQEGMNFVDGGAFTSITVQVRNAGVWSDVTGLNVTPAYPGLNGVHFQTFDLTFTPTTGDAIRVFGPPAGAARFVSIAELEVYGSEQAGPPPNLPPSANAGADRTVTVNTAVTLSGSGADPEGLPVSYLWSQIGGPVVTLSGATTATPSFTAPASATTLTFQLVTSDGASSSTPDTVVVTVSVPQNLAPSANAGTDRTVNVGTAVTLSGSGSDPEGLPVSYLWSQIGGASVTLTGATTATPSFTAPAMATTLTFQLVTNDGVSNSPADAVVVTVNDPSAPVAVNLTAQGTPIALITAPTGGGNKNLDLIKDGVKPAVGTNNDQLQYDTFAGGGARPSDWIGYSFTAPKQLTRLVFQEGMNFVDGGAFTSITVQVRNSGVWTDVVGLAVNPAYPGLNGVHFQTFELTFSPITGDGVRVFGPPAGAARFISIAELEVWGTEQAGPPPNLPPTANAGTDRSVNVGTAVTLSGSGSDPEGLPVTYLWSQIGGPVVTLSGATTATPSFTAPASATTLTFQLVTSDGASTSTADTVVVTVSVPQNLAPSANAGSDRTVNVGTAVTLSGSGSDPEGLPVSYLWSQIGGPVVTLSGASTATPSFTAPASATTLTFQLVTNDGVSNSPADSVNVVINDPSAPVAVNLTAQATPIALITAPTGGGNKNLDLIKDGVKPAVGTNNDQLQYDTFAGGGARPSDWIGYSFTSAKQLTRLVFQEGMNFSDGGAFTSLTVQVRNGGVWTNVTGLVVTPAYPGLNGVHYQTFELTFAPVSGDGIRVYGPPAGAARFVSVAELEVWGTEQAGPPPNLPPTAEAGPNQTVNVGATVTLNGSGADPEGQAITYSWTQIGGVPVTLSNDAAAAPTFTAPALATTITFELVTSDGQQESLFDTVDITVNDPAAPVAVNITAAGTPTALITAPTGGGAKNLSLIKDGVKPAVGTNNPLLQYDTFNGGGARANDWVGYTFTSTRQFSRLLFQEGMNFVDGGGFTNLTVQVRNGSTWTTVTGVSITPTYAGLNGVHFESYNITFPSVSGNGIRIYGPPAGSARFTSIAELEVYGQ